ncbi:sensor domain-containing protein [Nocardioides dubius]|uniref:histidine kinase n=1 Tax=Nocardioides dubius TaxID=317019 RepID=A0ABP4E9V7_9ACTN
MELDDAWGALRRGPLRMARTTWAVRAWWYLVGSSLIGLLALLVALTLLALGMLTAPVLVGIPLLFALPLVAVAVAHRERRRLRLLQPGHETPADPRALPASPRAWWRDRGAYRPTAREVGFTVLLATFGWLVDLIVAANLAVVLGASLASPVLAHYDSVVVLGPWELTSAAEALPFALIAVPVTWVLGGYLLTALAAAQASLTRLLLTTSEQELARRVGELRASRLELVDAFEVERKRIERDLHDGVQQRLVALSMTLGQAELDIDDGPGAETVQRAQEQVREALAELRTTIRGIHPRVLIDLGLEAAVREIADRMPTPSSVHLDVPRSTPAAEAAGYFVVSEALTNVVRHSGARQVEITGAAGAGTLSLIVRDDGVGGADPRHGSGLVGLQHRLDALGGTLEIASPHGGPTEVRMRCPWPAP